MHGAPAGTFTFVMSGTNGVVFSKSFTCTDIKTALQTTDNYAHVHYFVIPSNPVQIEKGAYTFSLTATGYVSGTSFLAWVQQHEDIQSDLEYVPDSDDKLPLTVRYKSYKEGIQSLE